MEENAREREERIGDVWLARNCGRAIDGFSCVRIRFEVIGRTAGLRK